MAVVLIAAILAHISLMRGEVATSRQVVQLAQSRLMLHAGLMYLQEGSRIGWAGGGSPADATAHGPTFGWTDVRDGSLGPRGIRPAGAGNGRDDIPAPSWWQAGWPTYTGDPAALRLPAVADRRWPCPGSAMRGGMAALVRAPMAIEPRYASDPITAPIAYGQPGWDTPWTWPTGAEVYAGGRGALSPQPVADDWASFIDGQRSGYATPVAEERYAIRRGSEHLGWFRVYREVQGDHDADGRSGADSPSGAVDWAADSVALHDPANPGLKNWNVFVIACGGGATRGFRFWDGADPGFSRALEPLTASESGLFADEDTFRDLRAAETIQWFRVEWTPLIGGMAQAERYQLPWNIDARWSTIPDTPYGAVIAQDPSGRSDGIRNTNITPGGSFAWIQRLEREPPNW